MLDGTLMGNCQPVALGNGTTRNGLPIRSVPSHGVRVLASEVPINSAPGVGTGAELPIKRLMRVPSTGFADEVNVGTLLFVPGKPMP